VRIRVCPTLLEPQQVEVASSDPKKPPYVVTTATLLGNDAVCSELCPGYMFRGKCRHIQEATERAVCFYGTRDMSEEKCPKCGRELQDAIVAG